MIPTQSQNSKAGQDSKTALQKRNFLLTVCIKDWEYRIEIMDKEFVVERQGESGKQLQIKLFFSFFLKKLDIGIQCEKAKKYPF